jgi:hypothetical protein
VGSDNSYTIFNGFGYIGSTVFALPGVKGLIPNGRNADGTLNSTPFTVEKVLATTESSTVTTMSYIRLNRFAINFATASVSGRYYDEGNNYNYINGTVDGMARAGFVGFVSGKIDWFNLKTVFHALDYNDSSTISGWSMPSGTIINGIFRSPITTTGQTYTAPADGYVMVGASVGTGKALEIDVDGRVRFYQYVNAGHSFGNYTPVRKGQTVKVFVSYGGGSSTLENSYFEYAVGSV